MKILLPTEWFEPEPTFKGLLFARDLAARGHKVEVLTGFQTARKITVEISRELFEKAQRARTRTAAGCSVAHLSSAASAPRESPI